MQMIPPHKRISKQVSLEDFLMLAPEIRTMQDFLETRRSGSNVIRQANPLALHHAQVSGNPYKIFVIKRAIIGGKQNELVAILNAKILEKDPESKRTVLEGCLSFPDRGDKKVQRCLKVKVRFDRPVPSKEDPKKIVLEEKIEWVEGTIAQIFQHEIQHANGFNIYQK